MAEEAPKFRLVRCPKCGNVLPEPPNHSVYRCGSCDAVLRAKKKLPTSDDFLNKSNEKGNVDGYKKMETLTEKVSGRVDSLSEVERESDGVELNRRKDRVPVEENVNLVGVSSTRTKNKETLIGHDDVNASDNSKGLRVDQGNVQREVKYVDQGNVQREVKYGDKRRQSIDEMVVGDDHDLNLNRSKSVSSSVAKGSGEIPSQIKNSAAAMRSKVVLGRRGVERQGFRRFDEDPRRVPEPSRFGPSAYPDEGSSNRKPNSFYNYGEPMQNHAYPGHYRVENLEQDQAEIRRKLNDLKEQISRLGEKRTGRIPNDRNYIPRPPNLSHSHGPCRTDHNFYAPSRHIPDMISGSICKEPFWPQQQLRRPSNQPHHDYFSGRSLDFSQDLLASHSRENFLHERACSCLHCYTKNSQLPPKVPGIDIRTRRFAKYPARSNFYHNDNPLTVGRQSHHRSGVIPPLSHSQDLQPCMRWPTDIDSDVDGFRQSRLRRVVVAPGSKKFYRPIAGGAPFITCCKCFELLKLPRKLIKLANDQKKLRCGACSTVYPFEIKDRRLIISIPTETKQIPVEKGGIISSHNLCSNVGGTFDLQSTDTKPNLPLHDQTLNLREFEKRQGRHTSSSSESSEEEKGPNSVIVQRGIFNCAEQPSKDDMSPSVADSPFSDHLNGSSSIRAVSSTIGTGNRSKRTDQEKVILIKAASGKDSEKDAPVETATEVSFSEYLNLSSSQNSVPVSREEDQPRIKTGHKTFLTGFVKKRFRDFSRSDQSMENVRPKVSVNGHPIPDLLVKKAEQLAGPIHPGDYWYDFRAGFWGVMGQPCCGIIAPFIEEFNYSMPESCAAGNTNVFVNGRELHQTDLDLLVSRGLPNRRNKNYIIEISGKVVDEDSGQEVDSLGKLAPTVEKLQCGFGMRIPKVSFVI